MSEWIKDIPENPKFEWIKTSKKMPCPHQLILFMDDGEGHTIHYGVFCSGLSEKGKRNKFWCHIFQRSLHKKDVVLWSYIPEWEAFQIIFKDFPEEYRQLEENLWKKLNMIEESILQDVENDKCESKPYSNPGVVVRNTICRIKAQVLMIN